MNRDAKQATPHAKLLAEILNPCVPKNEREWAAAREIESLTREKEELEREGLEDAQRETKLLLLIIALRAELDAAKVDAERLDWIEQWIFDSHWGGSVSTPCTYWGIASNWRHIVKPMYGPSNFREAIDTARDRPEDKS